MVETSSLAAAFPPAAVDSIARINAARPPRESPDPPLDPAVTLDVSTKPGQDSAASQHKSASTDRAHYRRDTDSQQIVFQVVGPDGTVVEQLPSEAILRARAYAREMDVVRATEIGTAVARSA